MTIEERKAQLKQNLEDGLYEEYLRAAGLTDEQVKECLNVCKRALEGYYGDDKFSPEHNQYINFFEKEMGEIKQ